MAVAKLEKGDILEAKILLEDISSPELQPKTNILRIHAYGESEQFEDARNAYDEYEKSRRGNVIFGLWAENEQSLVFELKHRYISRKEPQQTNKWVFAREIELLASL